jgi:hypothetical protein
MSSNTVANIFSNGTSGLLNRLPKPAMDRTELNSIIGRLFNGFSIALVSIYRNMFGSGPAHRQVRSMVKGYIQDSLPTLLFLYGILFALCVFLFPLFLDMLFAMMPVWTFNLSKRIDKKHSGNLFLTELRSLDENLANKMEKSILAIIDQIFTF